MKWIYLTILTGIMACQKKTEFTHEIMSSLPNSTLSYVTGKQQADEYKLEPQNILLQASSDSGAIIINHAQGASVFNNIPAKYLNLDAKVEISRSEWKDYFLPEWTPMRGLDYMTLYIQSKQDKDVFYILVIHTGTDMEIARHSEDF